MFALIKWLAILGMLFGLWLVYDVYRDMSEQDQQTMLHKFNNKKTNLYERAKVYVHEFLD